MKRNNVGKVQDWSVSLRQTEHDCNSMKMRKKSDLPTKICAACKRPFMWRKKWERDWDNVIYCSDACRMMAKKQN